ncbi:hypothetical protein, partial [Ammoniphilus sp. CFH 90114]|uniref:hypothetical protein n=1 Tax=Ammoniphilus sp. CFH 90114 TaxID=2493665 RepID=UPI0013E9336A
MTRVIVFFVGILAGDCGHQVRYWGGNRLNGRWSGHEMRYVTTFWLGLAVFERIVKMNETDYH